jgi:tetratricopeptide (TPR) repeat protein
MSGREDFRLKTIRADGIAAALERADRYRQLNDPDQAESIYRDILAVDADNQDARRSLVLALTDQFHTPHGQGLVREAREELAALADAYDRAYYAGIIFEREARALLDRSGIVHSGAYDALRQAMECYERAESLRPGAVDALLRWNSCVRTIERERLEPEKIEAELPLE